MKYKIYSYNQGSQGAKNLALGLGCKRLRHNGNYRGFKNHILINWGNSQNFSQQWQSRLGVILNEPRYVAQAANKLLTFQKLAHYDVSTPPFTTSVVEANTWAAERRTKVVCRTILSGHSGAGIVISEIPNEIVQAPLYTKYIPKKKEFRVHVVMGEVTDVQEKRRRRDNDVNNLVRSYQNGWVFCRDNIVAPDGMYQLAIQTINALDLDFGAVDIIWNEKYNKLYVLEVNTAPGITGSTVDYYVTAFNKYNR